MVRKIVILQANNKSQTILAMKSGRDLPENITRTKNGYHVRVVIGGEYHAEYFSDLDEGKKKAFKKAKRKRKELVKKKAKYIRDHPKPEKYETRFLYETPHNSTGIIGVFIREDLGRDGKTYPYYCTTIVAEKDKPASYSRSMGRWGKGEALIQICCIRKRHMARIYPNRFDAERFDQSVITHMKEHYLSYTDDALKRLAECVE